MSKNIILGVISGIIGGVIIALTQPFASRILNGIAIVVLVLVFFFIGKAITKKT